MLRRHFRWFLLSAAVLAGTVAVSQTAPSITFQSPSQSWSVFASSNPLPFGQVAAVNYSADRLTQCRGNINSTTPGWSIYGYYQYNGGPVRSFWVAGLKSDPSAPAPSIPLDTRGDLAIWFQNTNRWGCSAYDSNFGNNFHFNVQ